VAAGRAAPGITKNIVSRANALEDEWQGFLDAYKASPEGKTPLPPKNVADTLLKIIDTRTYPGTEAKIPFASRSEFKQALNDAFEVTTPAPSPKAPPGVHGEIRTVAEARNMGFAVQGPDTYKVLLIPRKLDATRFEAMMGDLSTLAKEGASAVPPETYRQLVAAARSDRDAYPWPKEFGPEPTATTEDGVATKGFSAAHTKIHQKLSELEGQMKGAGIPKRRDVRGSDVLPDVEKSVRSYGREGQEPLTKALLDLAGSDPALQARLKEIPATGAAEALMQKGRYFKSGTPMTSGNVNAARLRIDPILGALGDILPKAIAPATGGRVADEKFKSLIRDLYGH
jgi:hypothetical protein